MTLADICSASGCISSTARRALRVAVMVSVLFATASGQSVQPHPISYGSVDAIKGIVSALRGHPVVLLGEDHWLLQAGDFYIALVRDPGFQEGAQDILVEFASRSDQALLDRYIGGEDVPYAEVEHIWRDTTKVASWKSRRAQEPSARIKHVGLAL
jgi:hypothetical protein